MEATMKKIIFISIMIWMLFSTTVFAADVDVQLPKFDVTINGEVIDNSNRQYPLLVYKDITYVPMTYYDCRYLGLTTDWDSENSMLSIEKSNITCAYRDYLWQQKNANQYRASVCNFSITVNNQEIRNDQEEYPLLTFRDVTYFPLTWRFAVDEFGWEYSFDAEKGLVISSDNAHPYIVDLPYCNGMVATDGVYYYYNGKSEDKNVIYRVLVADTSNPQIIHEIPNSDLSKTASLEMINGEVYINYLCGSGPTMSTEYYYKIEADGSLTRQNPSNYSGGKHGYNEVTKEEDGIFVKGTYYFDGPTKITYTINGVETEVEAISDTVQFGRKRNGNKDYSVNTRSDYIQIYKGKIYFTGIDLSTAEDSALYCIDTATGKTEKIIDGVWGFHVYSGWLNEEQADSTMIIYDSNGNIMRYEELTGNTRMIEKCDIEDVVLVGAAGDHCIYTIQKTLKGDRTIIKAFGDYANGYSSINGAIIGDTQIGTYVSIIDDKLLIQLSGEPKEDARLFIVDGNNYLNDQFRSADVASGIFLHNHTLLYMIENNKIVRVDL